MQKVCQLNLRLLVLILLIINLSINRVSLRGWRILLASRPHLVALYCQVYSRGTISMDVNRIDLEEARGLLESEQGYICLDVRMAEEFAAGHVPAAVNIPVVEKNPMGPGLVPNPDFSSQVEQQFDKDRKIITLCLRGVRSMHAATMMMALGYT